MDETYLSVIHSVSNRVCRKRSRNSIYSTDRYAFNSFFCLEPWSKDCTTFMLHDLTDFCVTAHRIKINYHSWFQPLAKLKNETKIKTSLRARVPLCFGGTTQLACSANREDRLWLLNALVNINKSEVEH